LVVPVVALAEVGDYGALERGLLGEVVEEGRRYFGAVEAAVEDVF
jgi:hypothetical protein